MKNSLIVIISLLIPVIANAADPTFSAVLNLSPTTSIIERKVGASIVISSIGGSSLLGASVVAVVPRVWVTNTGSSTTSFAFGSPYLGPGANRYTPGQTNLFGSSLTMQPIDFIFHAPSIYPAYGNSLQVGSQTYSVRADVLLDNGTTLYSSASTIKVLPIALPDSQQSGWH